MCRMWNLYLSSCMTNDGFLMKADMRVTRWWFQIFFIFTPTWGNDPIWRAYFSDGWFNHHLGYLKPSCFLGAFVVVVVVVGLVAGPRCLSWMHLRPCKAAKKMRAIYLRHTKFGDEWRGRVNHFGSLLKLQFWVNRMQLLQLDEYPHPSIEYIS